MITDPRVFEEEYIPGDLHHRHAEVSTLVRTLGAAEAAEHPGNALIVGPSGVGKTVTARHALAALDHERSIPSTQIRCLGASRRDILLEAVRGHPAPTALDPDTASAEMATSTLSELVADHGPYVLLLDEADGLATTVLTDFAAVPDLGVAAITHDDTRWLSRVDDDVRHEWEVCPQVQMDRYSIEETVDILRARADLGLRPGSVSREQLARIADEVAGVARYGIQSLRAAAQLATQRGHQSITDADVDDSFAAAKSHIREQNLGSLSFSHLVVYELIRSVGEISATELLERYRERAPHIYDERDADPVSDRQVRNYRAKLEDYDLIVSEGETRWRTYRPVDPDLEPPIDVGPRISRK